MFKKEQGKQIIQEHIDHESIVKTYIKGNLLGKGGFAKCYEFISQQTNRKYAAKIIEKASLVKGKAKQKLQSQIKIHKSLHHQHIVNFEHFFEDQEYVYILLQICRPQTLSDLLKRRKRITQFQTKYFIYQIVQALKYIHDKKVIHRDLKLGNLFLTDELHIKVGDFGLATKLNYESERKKTTCGTPNYLAPEILINKNGHSYEVDIWSIGIIAYALIFGRPPFETNDLKLTYSKIKNCNYQFPQNCESSSSAKKFITKILQLEPHKRPTLDQILQDEFICSIQIPKSLPLATISIPLSLNFIKRYEKNPKEKAIDCEFNSIKSHHEEVDNFSTYRKLKPENKVMSTEKLQTYGKKETLNHKNSKPQFVVMQRASSTAGLLQRNKGSSSFREALVEKRVSRQNIPSRVVYFEQNPKFGIAYMLNTNSFGMRYNDSSCIITDTLIHTIKYLTLQSTLKQTSSSIYQHSQVPKTLSKKTKILSHYVKELKKNKNQKEQKIPNSIRIQVQKMRPKQNPQICMQSYVVRSLKTSKAQFFEFNDEFIQVIFEDSSEVIFKNPKLHTQFKNEDNTVTYITKFSEMKQFSFQKLNQEGEDVKKRISYALSVIDRVQTSVQSKAKDVKENNFQTQNNSTKIKKNEPFSKSKSLSKMQIMMESNQNYLGQQNKKKMNSTTNVQKMRDLSKEIGRFPLNQILNNLH